MNAWFAKLYETFLESGYYRLILEGLGNTVLITLGALAIGVIIGTLISVIKFFSDENLILKVLAWVCDLYVTVIRGIPVTVLLMIFYFLVLASAGDMTIAVITFGINSGAYMAELIRSGIQAVDPGQMEAGRSLGMTKAQTMGKIIFPQAVRYILPAIGNEFIALVKETSVAGYVSIVDLTRAGNLVRNNTHDVFNPLMVVALTYLVIVVLLSKLLGIAERKLAKRDKG